LMPEIGLPQLNAQAFSVSQLLLFSVCFYSELNLL
jgi:hypothetical protein